MFKKKLSFFSLLVIDYGLLKKKSNRLWEFSAFCIMCLKVHVKQTTQSACTWESLVVFMDSIDSYFFLAPRNFLEIRKVV